MLNLILDYIEAADNDQRIQLYINCVTVGKKFAKTIEMWIIKTNREATFKGTPRITRSSRDKVAVSGGSLGGGQGVGRIADSLEQLVSLKRYELGLMTAREQGDDLVLVYDSDDSRIYNEIPASQVEQYRVQRRAAKAAARANEGQG